MWDRAGNIGKLSTWTIFQAVRNSLKTWPWSTTLFATCAKLHPVRNRESKEPNVEIWKTKGNFLRKMKIKESISAAHLQLKDEFRVKCCSWCTEVSQTLIVQTRNSPKSRNFYNLMSIAKGRVLFLLIASDSFTWGSLVHTFYLFSGQTYLIPFAEIDSWQSWFWTWNENFFPNLSKQAKPCHT